MQSKLLEDSSGEIEVFVSFHQFNYTIKEAFYGWDLTTTRRMPEGALARGFLILDRLHWFSDMFALPEPWSSLSIRPWINQSMWLWSSSSSVTVFYSGSQSSPTSLSVGPKDINALAL